MNVSPADFAKILQRNPDLRLIGNLDATPLAAQLAQMSVRSEADLQMAVIAECEQRAVLNPVWGLIYHPANGELRDDATAYKLKRMGLRRGVNDLVWPIARRGYHALYLELKMTPNKLSPDQIAWHEQMRAQGNWAGTVWDSMAFVMARLEWYLGGES